MGKGPCAICERKGGSGLGRIPLPAHRYPLVCEKHYCEWFKRRLIYSIERFSMAKKGEKILVGVSGGVDSAVLLFALKECGYSPIPIHLVLGKGGYFADSLAKAKKACARAGLVLEEIETGPELVGKNGKNPCATCSEIRNFCINRLSREREIPFATGHHLDDEAASVFEALLSLNPDVLGRRFPVVDGIRGFGKKIKPLCLFEKREIRIYARLKKIPHLKGTCEYSKEAKTAKWKALLDSAERKSPGFKLRLYLSYLEKGMKIFSPHLEKTGSLCKRCGKEPASSGLCVGCKYSLLPLGQN